MSGQEADQYRGQRIILFRINWISEQLREGPEARRGETKRVERRAIADRKRYRLKINALEACRTRRNKTKGYRTRKAEGLSPDGNKLADAVRLLSSDRLEQAKKGKRARLEKANAASKVICQPYVIKRQYSVITMRAESTISEA